MQKTTPSESFSSESDSIIQQRRKAGGLIHPIPPNLANILSKALKWIRQKGKENILNNKQLIYEISRGFCIDYSIEMISFLVNLVLTRCLLTKRNTISAKQAGTLQKFVINKPEFEKRLKVLVDKQIEKHYNLQTKQKNLKRGDETKTIKPEKVFEIDIFVEALIDGCLFANTNESALKEMKTMDLGHVEYCQLREFGLYTKKVNCTDWILIILNMLHIMLDHKRVELNVATNCVNFLMMIGKKIGESERTCPLKFPIYVKIIQILTLAQENNRHEVRKLILKAIKIMFKQLLENFHVLLKEQIKKLINYLSLKLETNKTIYENIKRSKKRKNMQTKIKNAEKQYNMIIENLENFARNLQEFMVELLEKLLFPFKKITSNEEMTLALDNLPFVLVNLKETKQLKIYEILKKNIFNHRNKLEHFVTGKALKSPDFKSILHNFLSLSTFNIFKTSVNTSNFKVISIHKTEKVHIQLDLRSHCLLDNMMFMDYSVEDYKGQVITQKNYLQVFQLVLHPNQQIAIESLKMFVKFLRMKNYYMQLRNKKADENIIVEIVLVMYQMALLKTFNYKEKFLESGLKAEVLCEFKRFLRLLQKCKWNSNITTKLITFYISLSYENIENKKEKNKNSKISNINNIFYFEYQELLSYGLLIFVNDYFQIQNTIKKNPKNKKTNLKTTTLSKTTKNNEFLTLFKSNRDDLQYLTFQKLQVFRPQKTQNANIESPNPSEDQQEVQNFSYSGQAIIFMRFLKWELRMCREGLGSTAKYAQELEWIQDEQLLQEMIEWVHLFGKEYPIRTLGDYDNPLEGLFEKNRIQLQTSLENNLPEMTKSDLTNLLKVRFSAQYLSPSRDLFTKLEFVYELLNNYILEVWTFKSVTVIKACLNLMYFSIKSSFLRTLDISLNNQKEKLLEEYFKIRPKVLKGFKALTLYNQNKKKLSYLEILEIRKEAFELFVKIHIIISNDIFAQYKLIYNQADQHDLESIVGFFVECIQVTKAIQNDNYQEEGKMINTQLISKEKTNINFLTESQIESVTQYNNLISSIMATDHIVQYYPEKQPQNKFEKSNLLLPNVEPKENNSFYLKNENFFQAKRLWTTQSGKNLQYYLLLIVCELLDQCSVSFGLQMGPHLIFQLVEDEMKEGSLNSVLYSFLRKLLKKDMKDRTRAHFWKYYLKAIQIESHNMEKVADITRLFKAVYQSQIMEIKRNMSKGISEKLKMSSEKKNEEIYENKIIYTNYVNFMYFLIQQIEPDAKDYRSLIVSILVDHLFRVNFFESRSFYTQVLIIFHQTIESIEGLNPQIKKQKIIVHDFLSVEISNPKEEAWVQQISLDKNNNQKDKKQKKEKEEDKNLIKKIKQNTEKNFDFEIGKKTESGEINNKVKKSSKKGFMKMEKMKRKIVEEKPLKKKKRIKKKERNYYDKSRRLIDFKKKKKSKFN
jgi:hypothetical protein